MSRATLYVQFPDGTLRYGLYNGTTGICCAPLYGTPGKAWDAYDLTGADGQGDGQPVMMATDYGDGSWWMGTALHDRVVSPHDTWDDAVEVHDGLPSWARYPGPGAKGRQ